MSDLTPLAFVVFVALAVLYIIAYHFVWRERRPYAYGGRLDDASGDSDLSRREVVALVIVVVAAVIAYAVIIWLL